MRNMFAVQHKAQAVLKGTQTKDGKSLIFV